MRSSTLRALDPQPGIGRNGPIYSVKHMPEGDVQTPDWTASFTPVGRRVSKKKSGAAEVRFVYDGWTERGSAEMATPQASPSRQRGPRRRVPLGRRQGNLVAETNAWGQVQRRYTWGLDASGTLQGAGGVGGLLMIQDGSQAYYPIYDSGHNVVALRDPGGSVAAAYDYDAFGAETARAGSYAATNPFRFSTKYTDDDAARERGDGEVEGFVPALAGTEEAGAHRALTRQTGLVYYGLRFYDPQLGRFVNRDPIEEAGGLNLYGFVGNDPANGYDVLGMHGPWDDPDFWYRDGRPPIGGDSGSAGTGDSGDGSGGTGSTGTGTGTGGSTDGDDDSEDGETYTDPRGSEFDSDQNSTGQPIARRAPYANVAAI